MELAVESAVSVLQQRLGQEGADSGKRRVGSTSVVEMRVASRGELNKQALRPQEENPIVTSVFARGGWRTFDAMKQTSLVFLLLLYKTQS